MEYRKDIQILRGIAVLLVVLFHLDMAGFKSGFLGVDVFFVISGYLMAMMYDPLNKMDFFAKRVKRLLPAYFAVVAFTLLISVVLTTPGSYWQVFNQAWFATFFASNIGFWMENSYFDKTSFKPLLHLWSIGVEIQFYLLVPTLYWIFRKLKLSYPLILLASGLLCFYVASLDPSTAFFWLPCRLWEFLIGFGVAKYIYKGRASRNEGMAWLGFAALVPIIGIPFFTIDGTGHGFMNGHPGLIALLVSLSSAVILSFGLPKKVEESPISSLLEKIGAYSYSIYLAHFPVIVLFLYEPFSGTVLKVANVYQGVMIGVLVVFASALLFKYVEQPFRQHKLGLRWACALAVVVVGLSPFGAMIQKMFTPYKEMLIHQALIDRSEFRCGEFYSLLNRGKVSCEITSPIKNPSHRVFLVGNSFADSIKTTFSSVAQAKNTTVFLTVQNDPLMKNSKTTLQVIVDEAIAIGADSVVLHYSRDAVSIKDIARLAALLKEKNIRLSIILPPPVWDSDVPMMLWKSQKGMVSLASQNLDDYKSAHKDLIEGLPKIDYENLKVYQLADVLCKNECRMTSDDGKPLYFDEAHLTLTGSEMLREVFERVLSDFSEQDMKITAK